MNCLQTKDNFSAYFEDSLDNQTIQQFDSHIAACASCQKEYHQFQISVKATKQLPEIEPSPNFVPLLWEQISDEKTRNGPFLQRLYDLFNIPKWAIGGILILVLAGAGTFIFHDDFFIGDKQSNDVIVYSDSISDEDQQNITTDQFSPRGFGGSYSIGTNSSQPMQQQYILKRVSYTSASLAGGL